MKELYNQLFSDGRYTKSFEEFQKQFNSQENAKLLFQNLSNDGLYTKEYADFQNQFSLGKAIPSVPGVAVEEIVAPENNTELQSGDGFLGSIIQGAKAGNLTAKAADETLAIFSKLGEAEKYEYDDFVNAVNKYNQAGYIKEFENWSSSYDSYIEKGNNPVMSTILSIKDEGIDGFSGVLVKSLTSLLSKESATAGLSAGYAGFKLAPGKRGLTVGISSAMAGMNAMSETMVTFAGSIQEELAERGLEFTGDNVRILMQDEKAAASIRNKSLARGVTIGAIEGVFTALGGKAFTTTARAVKGATNSPVAGKIVGSLATGVTEMVGGGVGEAAGLTIEGKPLDAKEIIVESVAGIGGAPVSIATQAPGLMKNTEYIINGSKVDYNRAKDIIDTADVEALAGMRIQIKNDNDFKQYAHNRQQEEIIKSQIDTRITNEQDRSDVFELEKELKKLQGKESETSKIRAKEIKKQIANISAKYRRSKIQTEESANLEQQKLNVQDKVAQRIKDELADPEGEISQTVSFAETAAEQIGLQEPTIVNNTKDFLNALKADNVKLDSEQLSQVNQNKVGGAVFNGKIYINKEVAAKTGQINVGAHEILHPITNARIKNQPQFVEEFKQKLTKNQRNQM